MLKRILAFLVYTFAVLVMTCIWFITTPVIYIGKAVTEVAEHLRDVVFPREEGEQDE